MTLTQAMQFKTQSCRQKLAIVIVIQCLLGSQKSGVENGLEGSKNTADESIFRIPTANQPDRFY
jgi:hypothetical protein